MVSTQQRFKFLGASSTWSNKKFECVDPAITQEQDGVASNGVFTAVPWKGNSTVAVFPAYEFKRFDASIPLLKGHNGAITDCAFSPFCDPLLATSAEDGKVKFWVVPEGGYSDHVKECDGELSAHSKKVLGI